MATNYQGFQFNSQPPQQNMFQSQQFFPQPQGNIYLINNSLEMANVPTGVGLSAAICLSEGVMYLKTIQNGAPMFVGYKIAPFDNTTISNPNSTEDTTTTFNHKEYIDRLEAVEKEISALKKTGCEF